MMDLQVLKSQKIFDSAETNYLMFFFVNMK